jgi:hypothetical protein
MNAIVNAVRPVDLAVVVIANLMNLLLMGMFLARAFGAPQLGHNLGSIVVVLGIPLAIAAALNAYRGRDWWLVILPALVVLYCAVEFALDYVLKIDFRNTSLLWPYLGLYYVSLMGMIGYAFLVGKTFGFVTLATYFVNLAATFYSFVRVGHSA